jgi:hypothetical protein
LGAKVAISSGVLDVDRVFRRGGGGPTQEVSEVLACHVCEWGSGVMEME